MKRIRLSIEKEYLLKDVSKKWEIQEELRIERERSVNAAKMASLGEIAAGVAHEINNPLTIILGYLEQSKKMINKKYPSEEQIIGRLDTTIETANRIAHIVKGLKSFSRDATNDELAVESINDIIEDTTSLCAQKIKIDNTDLIIENNGPLQDVLCRKSEISQVLYNLVNNSFDEVKNKKERWIKIITEYREEMLVLSVIDSGNGISRAAQNKIFKSFYTTKPVGVGTGLGLSISKKIMESHGGDLYYDNRKKNTTFVIEIPLAIKDSTSLKAS